MSTAEVAEQPPDLGPCARGQRISRPWVSVNYARHHQRPQRPDIVRRICKRRVVPDAEQDQLTGISKPPMITAFDSAAPCRRPTTA
jgi:hypothetical protein